MPWDCADWAAFVHEDRTTAILETLAENRGKTLYCGIDQSDAFTKAETWAAGRDRNERDDTIYWGERGNFRGFIAAQEGWLTEGESGITGQSTATIFEFPREQRGRRWKTKRLNVPPDSALRPIYSGSARNSDSAFNACRYQNHDTSAKAGALACFRDLRRPSGWADAVADASWQRMADRDAAAYCEEQGYQRVTRVTVTRLDSSYGYSLVNDNAPDGWELSDRQPHTGNNYSYSARKVNTWSAVCIKKVRGPRR